MICFCVLTEPGVTKAHQLSTQMRALSTQMSAHVDKTTATVQHILEKLDIVTTYVQSHAFQIFHISTGTSDICDMQKVLSSQYRAACLKMQMASNNTFFVLTICVALWCEYGADMCCKWKQKFKNKFISLLKVRTIWDRLHLCWVWEWVCGRLPLFHENAYILRDRPNDLIFSLLAPIPSNNNWFIVT
jgi:hypothetical protein